MVKIFSKFKRYKNKGLWLTFKTRNLEENALLQTRGGRLRLKRHSFLFEDEINFLYYLREKFNYILFDKVSIPQIEFALTTRCSLRCKNCINYIPYLNNDEQKVIELDEFKVYIDNLTAAVNKIEDLLLLGGEPLLLKNIDKYLEYVAKNNKIKRVWLVTNGTIVMSDDLIRTIKKYHRKVIVWLSNYSANKELEPRLKHDKILAQIKMTKAKYIYNKDLNWSDVSQDLSAKNRTKIQNINYFKVCGNKCVSVFGETVYVCPRAGTYHLKKLYEPENNEIINLNNKDKKSLRKEIIRFYENKYFQACDFCNFIEDRQNERITPAIQLKENQF